MTTFTDLQSQLAAHRTQQSAAALEVARTREQLSGVKQQIATLGRTAGREQGQEAAALREQAEALGAKLKDLSGRYAGLRSDGTSLLGHFAALADPAAQAAQLNDSIPILLFPVRLETRFHQSGPLVLGVAAVASTHQLWIRIYPDDCQVDSFEELLTKSDLDNATSFWTAMWRAGGVEAQERGAWRVFVGGSGSGRAAYIIKQFAPQNPADKLAKIDPQDVVLVIVPQTTVTAAEQAAANAYFTAVWKADGDTAREGLALATLTAAVGAARRDIIRAQFAPDPTGWDPPQPFTRAQVRVSVAVLNLPPAPVLKQTSWTEAPKAFALPDRFVATLWNSGVEVKQIIGNPIPDGLATGPDPSLSKADQIKIVDDDLDLNDDLLWISDFERAVAVGMGIKVDLTAAEAAAGFDRLLVLGIRFSSDAVDGQKQLQTLIAHHYASRHGFSLVPQGSPTNNTEAGDAAYSWVDDADTAYDVVFKGKDEYVETDDPMLRRDGQWLAEALGVDDALLKQIPNAGHSDQSEARAMNVALWQTTLGYAMEEMLAPIFSPSDIAATLQFFTHYVSGRGPLPAVRVGREPYGVLPAMAFSRYHAQQQFRVRFNAGPNYLERLHTLLLRASNDWQSMSGNVPHVGQAGDPHQTLLNIVGLMSGSVEYHQRYAESFDELYNKLVAEDGGFFGGILANFLKTRGQQLLTALGADPNANPPILEKFFYGGSAKLTGPIVDDSPLSETKPVRAYTPDKKNYLEWLATSTLDAIRQQDFGGNAAPTALLYLLLRHAMMLAHWDAGTRLLENRGLVTAAVARSEAPFIHVQADTSVGLSKFAALYSPAPAVTGSPTTTLAEYVLQPFVLANAIETIDLRAVLASLELLKDVPTARLERLFAEHIDCCTYRLDAWKTGLTATRLGEMRFGPNRQKTPGVYLGAFGWLENLRPKADALTAVPLDADLGAVFARPGDAPLRHDPTNAGYIHAPSLNHAAAAAILKNAYRVNASPANPDAMAVNLTSDRVRKALGLLEGIRNGQPLAGLLGYRLERGLHDEHDLAEVDKFIYPIRQLFPLVSGQLASTKADPGTDITLLEANNVVDGLKLLTHIRTSGSRLYPFGFPIGDGTGQLPSATNLEQIAINIEIDALSNLYDAVGDLVTAESVYQVVQGNFDRAAANTNAFSEGNHPPEIQIVDTPRTGLSLTHRVALHLDPDANPAISPSAVPMTPRAKAEAPLNLWLANRIPVPGDIVVQVTYATPALAAPKSLMLSQLDLKLQPVDLLYLINLDLDQALAELDDRIIQIIRYGADAHPAMAITIEYMTPVASKTTLFELAAEVRSLRALILKSRAIGPTDMAMPLEAKTGEAVWDDTELQTRIEVAITTLTAHRDALVLLEADVSDLDDYARKVSDEFLAVSLYGIPRTGVGGFHSDMRAIFQAIQAKLQDFVTRWNQKDLDYAALLATLPSLTTDDQRYALLKQAEGLIASSTTAVLPATPTIYQAAVDAKKNDFDARLTQLRALLVFGGKLVDYALAADAMTPLLAEHDAIVFDIGDQKTAIQNLRDTMPADVTAVADDLTQRLKTATDALTAAQALVSSQAKVQALQAAARGVLGDEFVLVPRFVLAADHAAEFNNAFGDSSALLTDLKASGRRFPVDDWMYGLARVRDKLGAWENVAVLSEAFGAIPADLTPVQLPYKSADRWLALDFDPSTAGTNSRLLYTGYFSKPFSVGAEQCALLLDEWTELVPGTDVDSGVTFHFDRPSSAPPQAMLLVVPPVLRGNWQWDDLLATLNETLDGAKSRGVDPAQVDQSSYAQLLPATLMAVTLYQITIATNLGINNHIYDRIDEVALRSKV